MKIFFAADHAGFLLKEALKDFAHTLGHEVEDMGALTLAPDDDYPDYVTPLAAGVAASPGSFGVIVGGSGQGEAMAANRVRGVRALLFYGTSTAFAPIEAEGTSGADGYDIVRLARKHNDANVLSLGARFVSGEVAREALRVFIDTAFSGGERHRRRIAKF